MFWGEGGGGETGNEGDVGNEGPAGADPVSGEIAVPVLDSYALGVAEGVFVAFPPEMPSLIIIIVVVPHPFPIIVVVVVVVTHTIAKSI